MSKFKMAYYNAYRPIMDKYIDKYFILFVYHVVDIIEILSLHCRGFAEDYIINRGYANLSQYEKVLTDKSIVFLTMQIDARNTWIEIYHIIHDLTKIRLSKRQCYKLKEYAKEDEKKRKAR